MSRTAARTPLTPTPDGSHAFKESAGEVIAQLRGRFAEVIETALGRAGTAAEVADGFGVHRKLGWQIAHLAYDDDPFLAARFVPTSRSLKTWLEAAERKRVPADLLASLAEAFAAFERLIETHAADRESLEMMLEACSEHPDAGAAERRRREAFSGNSYIWGVRVRTQLSAAFLAPSSDRPGWFDMARLNGMLGFVRTRPDVRWVIAQSVAMAGEEGAVSYPTRCALDSESLRPDDRVPLIRQFSSEPAPEIVRRPGEHGLVEDELSAGPMGQSGETDIVTGEVLRNVAPAAASYPGEEALFGAGVRTPAEVIVCDLYAHEGVFGAIDPEARVYGELFSQLARDERDRLQTACSVTRLGRGLSRVHTPDVPHYSKMAEYVFDRLGWKAREFEVFRIRMAYPPMPASVMFHFALPEAEGQKR